MRYKKDDEVVCISKYNTGCARLTFGKSYKVLDVQRDRMDIYLDIEDDDHFTEPVHCKHFKLIRHYKTKLGKILYSVKTTQQ